MLHSTISAVIYMPSLVVGMFALALLSSQLLFESCSRLFGSKSQLLSPVPNKLASLEGLRGILAFSIVAHHACGWYNYAENGSFNTDNSLTFARLAGFGINQFFFLSGFLFWRKLRKQGTLKLSRFYWSRFLRIAPVYYVCLAISFLVAFARSGLAFVTSTSSLLFSVLAWSLFGLFGKPDFNGIEVPIGVVWTLAQEWLFYFSLPFLPWFVRRKRRLLPLLILVACLTAVLHLSMRFAGTFDPVIQLLLALKLFGRFMIFGFGGGIIVATFEDNMRARIHLNPRIASSIVAMLYAIYLLVPRLTIYGEAAVLLTAFTLIVLGADLFGLLLLNTSRLLGTISYDLYLVHSIVFVIGINYLKSKSSFSFVHASVWIATLIPISVACALLLHWTVERPFMILSEKYAKQKAPDATSQGRLKNAL